MSNEGFYLVLGVVLAVIAAILLTTLNVKVCNESGGRFAYVPLAGFSCIGGHNPKP